MQLLPGVLAIFVAVAVGDPGLEKTDIVATSIGAVQGLWLKTRGISFYNGDEEDAYSYAGFLGIPYAEPPVGDLRFRDPVPIRPWPGVLDAVESGSRCVQPDGTGSEDCLFLNVYTPSLPKNDCNDNKLYPVMVFIHGGAFMAGSSDYEEYGPDFLIQADIVIVTLNYRLGAAGFLSTEDESAPGNAALKDQLLVLKWVQENIQNFSGDSMKVTIFGWSAGSSCVHMHVLSPRSKGLFQQAICESGTAYTNIFSSDAPSVVAFQLGKKLGINTTSSKDLINNLRQIPIADIIATKVIFTPSVENANSSSTTFISRSFQELTTDGGFNRVPLMIGTTAGEGIALAEAFNIFEALNTQLQKLFDWLLQLVVSAVHADITDLEDIKRDVLNYYLDDKEISIHTLPQLINLGTDIGMVYPTIKTVQTQHQYQKIYMYRFNFIGDFSFVSQLFNLAFGLCGQSSILLPSHADDISYLYRFSSAKKYIEQKYVTESNKSSSYLTLKRMVSMWTSFIKFGNPTPPENKDEVLNNITWLPVTNQTELHLEISENLTMVYKLPRTEFWSMIEDKYGKSLVKTEQSNANEDQHETESPSYKIGNKSINHMKSLFTSVYAIVAQINLII